MTIRLHPCASTIICGPCIPCKEFNDLSRTGPDARVVYVKDAVATAYVSGAVTYNTGGSPTTVGMTVVAGTHKLCLGRNQSITGPLVYVSGIPVGATITEVVYTYNNGAGDVPCGGDVSASCTDYLTQILRITGALDCDGTPTVVLLAGSCNPCTEATGTSTSTGGGAGGTILISRNSICTLGSNSCVSTATTSSHNWTNQTLLPPTWTPASGSRPCNWTGLDFTTTIVSSLFYSGAGTPTGGRTFTCTYTKTAGSNILTVTSAANNAVGAGCVTGYDQLVRTAYITQVHTMGEYEIPCTGYKIRQRHSVVTSDLCNGGGRAIPEVNQIYADLMPR